MPVNSEQPFADHVSLTGDEADIYEAIATLEFIGRPPTPAEISTATGLDRDCVRETLATLTERGILIMADDDTDAIYEPAHRGWSTVPDQAAGPLR